MPLDRRSFLVALAGAGVAACSAPTRSSLAAPAGDSGPDAATGATPASPVPTGAPTSAPAPTTTAPLGPARYVDRGTTAGAQVALTFHTEGTVAQVGRLLDMARTLEVPLTMLIVGKWLAEHRDLGRRIADAGHDIGNHTYTHPSLPDQSRAVVADEIRRGVEILRDATGTGGRWFRPSGSNSTTTLINEEAGKAGYPIVLGFDTDPLDYQDPGPAAVRTRTLAGAHAGSLVSLHAQHQGTIDIFESLVGGLRDKGFTLVAASSMVA